MAVNTYMAFYFSANLISAMWKWAANFAAFAIDGPIMAIIEEKAQRGL